MGREFEHLVRTLNKHLAGHVEIRSHAARDVWAHPSVPKPTRTSHPLTVEGCVSESGPGLAMRRCLIMFGTIPRKIVREHPKSWESYPRTRYAGVQASRVQPGPGSRPVPTREAGMPKYTQTPNTFSPFPGQWVFTDPGFTEDAGVASPVLYENWSGWTMASGLRHPARTVE